MFSINTCSKKELPLTRSLKCECRTSTNGIITPEAWKMIQTMTSFWSRKKGFLLENVKTRPKEMPTPLPKKTYGMNLSSGWIRGVFFAKKIYPDSPSSWNLAFWGGRISPVETTHRRYGRKNPNLHVRSRWDSTRWMYKYTSKTMGSTIKLNWSYRNGPLAHRQQLAMGQK